jgi:hypothetical protein
MNREDQKNTFGIEPKAGLEPKSLLINVIINAFVNSRLARNLEVDLFDKSHTLYRLNHSE